MSQQCNNSVGDLHGPEDDFSTVSSVNTVADAVHPSVVDHPPLELLDDNDPDEPDSELSPAAALISNRQPSVLPSHTTGSVAPPSHPEWQQLHPRLLGQIFSFLPSSDFAQCSCVCSGFYMTAELPFAWMYNANRHVYVRFSEKNLVALCESYIWNKVTHVTFICENGIKGGDEVDSNIGVFQTEKPKKPLFFRKNSMAPLTQAGVHSIDESLTFLSSTLRTLNCFSPSNEVLTHLCLLRNLQTLHLNNSVPITIATVGTLVELVELEVSSTELNSDLGTVVRHLSALFALRTFAVRDPRGSLNDCLSALVDFESPLPHSRLHDIRLLQSSSRDSNNLFQEDCVYYCLSLGELRRLHIDLPASHLSFHSIAQKAELNRLPLHLSTLVLNRLVPSSLVFENLLLLKTLSDVQLTSRKYFQLPPLMFPQLCESNWRHSLRRLYLANLGINRNELQSGFQYCAKLKQLVMKKNPLITNQELDSLAALPNLEDLHFEWCDQLSLTADSMRSLSRCAMLRQLTWHSTNQEVSDLDKLRELQRQFSSFHSSSVAVTQLVGSQLRSVIVSQSKPNPDVK